MKTVTVLMSVYNGQRYLRASIESILGQTWQDFEFLIINDASEDESRNIILSYPDPRIRLVDNALNIGLTKSLNHGLQMARGRFVARQDADDISGPTRLEKQVRFLNTHPEVALVGAKAQTIDANGKKQNIQLRIPTDEVAIRWVLMFQNPFIHSSVMFRPRIVLDKLGGYNESFIRAQDYELWSRVARGYSPANLPDILVSHRFEYGSVVSSLPADPETEEVIILGNLNAFLDLDDIPKDWARFINRLRYKDQFDENTNWRQVKEMFDQIFTRYCNLHPDARNNTDIQEHTANILYWLSYYAAAKDRQASVKTYKQAMTFDRKGDRHPSLIKYAVLWVAGDRLRKFYHRLRFHWRNASLV